MSASRFAASFAALPDPRLGRNRQHLLLEMLVIAFCAVVCGAEGWEAIERFGLAKRTFLQERLGLTLPGGIPSDDTFRRVFSRLDPQAFGDCFRAWTQTLRGAAKKGVLALDGKALRHSFDTAAGQSPLHLVSAWAAASRLVLGQVAVADKSNEITAVPALLALLDLEGCLVTADAMSCQKTIAAQIIAQGGDYVLALKGNHPHLAEDVALCLDRLEAARWPDRPTQRCRTLDFGHGRQEQRQCLCVTLGADDPQWGDIQAQWPGLRCLVKVERRRKQAGKTTREVAYFLSSLLAPASRLARVIRQHWQVENCLHWVLDVVWDEDACRIRRDHAPQNFAVLRHMALNQLRQEKSGQSLKGKQQRAGWDDEFLLKVLQS